MFFTDLMEETFFSISSNKSRSALTILGIIIGIGSVIAMISIGQGATKDITSRIESLGTNLLVVMPGSQKAAGNIVRGGMGSATSLTTDDAQAIESSITDAQNVAPTVSSRKQVTIKGKNTNTSIYGIDSSYFIVKDIIVETGSGITDAQSSSKARVAVLGPTARDDLFDTGVNPIGQKIRIGAQEFSVIGVTQAKGGTGMGSADDLIYIPITTAQQYLTGSKAVNNISIQVSQADLMSTVQAQIQELLLQKHNISDPASADFSIMNQADMLSAMSSVAGTLTLLLGAIAGISLLVGGIGIMNMMLTSVTERTREIGLRKSLGAKNLDINWQFLAESVTITFIGGVIGIAVGWGASWLINKISGMTTVVNFSSVAMAFGISALIGVVFGFYPARRASKLDPIEALRFQ